MDVLGAHSYDTLVELEREDYHERELKRWLGSFSCGDQAYIWRLLGDVIALLHTKLDWHLLEVITSCWDLTLRCVTIGDLDLVPTLEEYDRFLSFSTPLSTVFTPPVWTRYRKRLVVEALTWHGSEVEGSMSFEFLHDRFHLSECLFGYRDDFLDLEEQLASYRRQAFLVAFFGTVLFPSPSGAISFSILPLVSVLPHSTSFIPALLSKTIRSLSLCTKAGRGRLGYCVHMLQLWFCSHLSVIARDQPMGFVSRNKVWATVSLDLPFSEDTDGWLRYLCSLSPTD